MHSNISIGNRTIHRNYSNEIKPLPSGTGENSTMSLRMETYLLDHNPIL